MSILHRVHHHAKRHYEKHYVAPHGSRAHLVFILDAVLVTCALSLLALACYFRWYYHPLRDTFRLQIAPAGEVVGAQEVGVGVSLENTGKLALKHGVLKIYLPPTFLAADGREDLARTFEIGDVPPGVPVRIELRGYPMGAPHAEKIIAVFTADDGQGAADERLTSADFVWSRGLIQASFDLPPAAVPGQNLVFSLHVKNGSSLPFNDVSMIPEWPRGFHLSSSTPPVYRGLIKIGALAPGQEADLEFSGRLDPASDNSRFGADVAGYFEDRPFPLTSASSQVATIDAGLKLGAAFADPAPAYVRTGTEVPVTVRYSDQGTKTLTRVTLSIVPDPATIASVRWADSSVVDALRPGESGERTAYVRLKDQISQYSTNPILRIVPRANFDVPESGISAVTIDGDAVTTKIAGDAKIRAAARYFTNEGDQIGRGPLPPKVGKSTTYWILTSLQTGASEVQDGTVEFSLPDGVAWTGRAAVTAGDDLRLEGSHLIWRLGTIAAHAATTFEAPSASFEVSLTPSASQEGTSPDLLKNAVFTGLDAWTGIDLSSITGGLDTRLPGDPRVAGRTDVAK